MYFKYLSFFFSLREKCILFMKISQQQRTNFRRRICCFILSQKLFHTYSFTTLLYESLHVSCLFGTFNPSKAQNYFRISVAFEKGFAKLNMFKTFLFLSASNDTKNIVRIAKCFFLLRERIVYPFHGN